jgi:AcrR family transcriptional regulator
VRTVTERSDAIGPLATVFRIHGFEGASLATISASTGLGKGSLYNFFPGGKEEMARAVLDDVAEWFRQNVNDVLTAPGDPGERVDAMFEAVTGYFRANQFVCLFGAFALGQERPAFARQIDRYFADWVDALAQTLRDSGRQADEAAALALDVVAGIQGALVIARASDDPGAFDALLQRLRGTVKLTVV